jgi:hypothetical protein
MPDKSAADWITDPGDLTYLLEFFHDQRSRIGDGGNFDKTFYNDAATHMAKKGPPKAGGPKTATAIMNKWKAVCALPVNGCLS